MTLNLLMAEIDRINRENPDYCMGCGDISKGNQHFCSCCEAELERYSDMEYAAEDGDDPTKTTRTR